MVEAFDIQDVNPNPARFDLKKAEAINAAHMRLLTLEDMTERVIPFLQHAGLVADPVTDEQRAVLDAAMPLVGERINKLTEAVDMLGFLFVDEADFALDPADAEKLLDEDGLAVVQAAYDARLGPRRVDHRRDRGGAAGEARRRAGPQAPQRLRPGPRRRHRAPDLAAAVRVAGAAGSRPRPGPAPESAGVSQPAVPAQGPAAVARAGSCAGAALPRAAGRRPPRLVAARGRDAVARRAHARRGAAAASSCRSRSGSRPPGSP